MNLRKIIMLYTLNSTGYQLYLNKIGTINSFEIFLLNLYL